MTTYKGYLILKDALGSKNDSRFEAYMNNKVEFVANSKEVLYDTIDQSIKEESVKRGIEDVRQGRPYISDIGYGATVLDINKARLNKTNEKPRKRVRATLIGDELTVEYDEND